MGSRAEPLTHSHTPTEEKSGWCFGETGVKKKERVMGPGRRLTPLARRKAQCPKRCPASHVLSVFGSHWRAWFWTRQEFERADVSCHSGAGVIHCESTCVAVALLLPCSG